MNRDVCLICAATVDELEFCSIEMGRKFATGAGVPLTLVNLEKQHREQPFSLLIQIGIAGAYAGSGLDIGEVVCVTSECFGDIGVEQPIDSEPVFKPVHELGFGEEYVGKLSLAVPRELPVKTVPGCTVNTCTGTAKTGKERFGRTGASIETMEGAAAALFGKQHQIPVLQFRSISNLASTRDMRPENIRLALRQLREFFDQHQEWFQYENILRHITLSQ